MRIYLDSNVFRDLKKTENEALYELILADKDRNYYCFSEAHIQDLVQDNTDLKLSDMDFMGTIVGNNCWHYDKVMDIRFRTPREYYNDYSWGEGIDLMTGEDPMYVLIRESFSAIPLNLGSLINPNDLPADFPEDLRPMLLQSATMLDFMNAMLDLTENLTSEQKKFKNLLQYLHGSLDNQAIYEALGIKGYNGKTVVDLEAFAESFKKLIYERSQQKDLYNQFIEMQYALDIYGIVKGKPRKQKFMSLLNDGKHAYYAGHAHILVTADVDMAAKVKLVYGIWNISTMVLTPDEFNRYLMETFTQNDSVAALFAQFNRAAELPIIYERYTLDQTFIQKQLPIWYLREFNTLSCVTARGNTYYYFRQYFPIISIGPLTVELERIVNQFDDYFGIDELGRGKLERKEIGSSDWQGREWRNGEMGILLHLNDGVMISFFKAAPIQETNNETSI